jgi:hypothetical protein
MQTSVELQEPFTYSIIPIVIIICFILAIMCYLIYLKKQKKEVKVENDNLKLIPDKNKKDIPVIKGKYLDQLNSIEYKYTNNMIDLRKAYQLISEAIRMFVFEITDITTQNYSLKEIKKLNIPNLYELIKEYYEPEFASKSVGDFETSINKARRVIKEWN